MAEHGPDPQSPFRHPGRVLAGVTLVVALLVGWQVWQDWTRQAARQGPSGQAAVVQRPRPPFALTDLQGRRRSVKEWDGKVLAINFWATWCPPCRREIPSFNALQREYGPRGVQFLGVAVDDPKAVRAFLQELPVAYPVLLGEKEAMEVAVRYGDEAGVLPFTAIVDRQGRIAFVRYGELSEALARQVIESLL